MSDLTGPPAELRATIHITRKDGQVETFELVGHSDPEKLAEIVAAERKHHGTSGALLGPGSAVSIDPKE